MASSFEKDQEDRSLECPICCEIYKEAKSLSCGHSICGDCLQRMPRNRLRQVKCPICRADVPTNRFQTNYALQAAADATKDLNDLRDKATESVKVFYQKMSYVCEQFEKLPKRNKLSELLNGMAAKSFEMIETTQSMDKQECQKALEDIEEMTKIMLEKRINDGPYFSQEQETSFFSILKENQDNVLFKGEMECAEKIEAAKSEITKQFTIEHERQMDAQSQSFRKEIGAREAYTQDLRDKLREKDLFIGAMEKGQIEYMSKMDDRMESIKSDMEVQKQRHKVETKNLRSDLEKEYKTETEKLRDELRAKDLVMHKEQEDCANCVIRLKTEMVKLKLKLREKHLLELIQIYNEHTKYINKMCDQKKSLMEALKQMEILKNDLEKEFKTKMQRLDDKLRERYSVIMRMHEEQDKHKSDMEVQKQKHQVEVKNLRSDLENEFKAS